MIKVTKILENKPYKLLCTFNNGETKELDMEPIFAKEPSKETIDKLRQPKVFQTATIGSLGQIYWPNAANMLDENGKPTLCEYDISPEFAYHFSVKVSNI